MSSPSSHSSSTEFNGCGDGDFEIPIATIIPTTPSADRQNEDDDRTKETTPSLGIHVDESEDNDGFWTPTNMAIPLTTVCPPAPRKPKLRKRYVTSLIHYGRRQQDAETDLQLVIDVGVWLDFMEDEDRKRMRIKRARRQEDQAGNDTTTTIS